MNLAQLKELCRLVRYDIITSTTAAGSGHPSSSLSATELMTTLYFGGFLHYDLQNPKYPLNDRVIFSKGHASPLLYSLYQATGILTYKQLLTLRKFDSILEGHPSPRFKYVDVATGALGQGLSLGLGMALGIKLLTKKQKVNREPKVWVLMGDSEFAEGQIWEALEVASYYKLNNLIGILDVNRLGQRGETMLGWDIRRYDERVKTFGWETIVVDDGHNLEKVYKAFQQAETTVSVSGPKMIIAKTIKGKGVSFMANADGWHGKAVPKDKLDEVLKELGPVDLKMKGKISKPTIKGDNLDLQGTQLRSGKNGPKAAVRVNTDELSTGYTVGSMVATREAYGESLAALGKTNPNLVVFDAEVSNSTYAEKFQAAYTDRYFEMFITEQNMVSAALGISKIGFIPFSSTFAAFLTRAFDQIRMAQYSQPNLKFCGSHAGVSIGQDGPSQMGLEDLAMMRSILESVVFYPSDAVSAAKMVEIMSNNKGTFYLRTTREKTPVIYKQNETFSIGGSKILRQSGKDIAVVFAAGITLHESLKAHEELKKEGVNIAVVDIYCVKPIDYKTIQQFNHLPIIVVEDHYPAGGLGEAVESALLEDKTRNITRLIHLSVRQIPRSGSPDELLNFEQINAAAIIKAVKQAHK